MNTSSSSSVSAHTETTTYSHIEAVPAEMCCAYLYNIKRDINCFTSTANVSLQRRPRRLRILRRPRFSFGGRVEHTNKSVVHVSISETDHRHDFFGLTDFATLGDFNCLCQSPTSRRLFYEKKIEIRRNHSTTSLRYGRLVGVCRNVSARPAKQKKELFKDDCLPPIYERKSYHPRFYHVRVNKSCHT